MSQKRSEGAEIWEYVCGQTERQGKGRGGQKPSEREREKKKGGRERGKDGQMDGERAKDTQ